ncbi:MAG: DUF2971 domain-containing protein [Alphaproteobacteria bacterium]|nr:DUF2971 domain-containing protein [Alphaproteobacteria bacterium]MBU1550187.1 DUF2971 domain-containing protein [Alphaproteobacteria bacterium]MBU2337892.1 DUF2971 domain-containing protein [Alphaproteobacteria bacterium]MBU2387872.1 DUF2971 domain-containing protein [Alphaproteobacteria bacterium]
MTKAETSQLSTDRLHYRHSAIDQLSEVVGMHDEISPDGLVQQSEVLQPLLSAFSGFSKSIVEKIYKDQIIPASLFHYTSAAGLIGIVSNHTIWFSDAIFMNDGSEATYGLSVFSAVINEFMADKSDAEKNAAEALQDQVKAALRFFQPIIFCMSARNNLLNQWRDYGRDIVPYCIEFDMAEFENWQGRQCNFPIFVTKVVYDAAQQRSLTLELIEAIYNRAKELLGDREHFSDEELNPLLSGAAAEIVVVIGRFKNPAFEAEEEWRAISYRSDVEDKVKRKYRASSLGAVPFYEWYSSKDPKNLPIKSVTVGPSPYAQVSDLALKQLLVDHGYGETTHFSLIPIRR